MEHNTRQRLHQLADPDLTASQRWQRLGQELRQRPIPPASPARPVGQQLLYGKSRQGTKRRAPNEVERLAARLTQSGPGEVQARKLALELAAQRASWSAMQQAIEQVVAALDGRDTVKIGGYSWRAVPRVSSLWSAGRELRSAARARSWTPVLQATKWYFLNEDGSCDYDRPSWGRAILIDPLESNGSWAVFEEELDALEKRLVPQTIIERATDGDFR